MASFGAKNPYFNKIATEPEGALPTYGPEEPVKVGKLVKADFNIQMASGETYADDELAERVEEFASGTIAMETDDMVDDVAKVLYGCEVEEKKVHYKSGDTPPYGGLTYYKKLMRQGKIVYKGYFYPKAKTAVGNDTAQTKGSSITFGTSNTSFTVFACKSGDYRITEEFDTEPEALAWVKKQISPVGD